MKPVRFDFSDPDAAAFCPSCGAGYAPGATCCLDCDSALVPRSEIEAQGGQLSSLGHPPRTSEGWSEGPQTAVLRPAARMLTRACALVKRHRQVLVLPERFSAIFLACLGAGLIGKTIGELLVLVMGERIAVFPHPLFARILPGAWFLLWSMVERDMRLRVGWASASFAILLDSNKEEWQLGAWALYLALLGHVVYFRAVWPRVDRKWRRRAALILVIFFIFGWHTSTWVRGRHRNWWPPYRSVISEEVP